MAGWLRNLVSPAGTPGELLLHLLIAVVASVLLLGLLHRLLGPRGRRWLIAFVTFAGGLYLGLEYFWPVHGEPKRNFMTPGIEPVGNMLAVVGAFTVGLGIYSLCQVHGRNILRARKGWHNSLAFLIAMIAMTAFGLWEHYLPQAKSASETMPWPRAAYEVLFSGLLVPLQAATFSLLAFYIASAAYRAFRIQTAEAALMMASAFVVMLGQVPIGTWLTSSLPPPARSASSGWRRWASG